MVIASGGGSEALFTAAKFGLLSDLRNALAKPGTHVALRGTDGMLSITRDFTPRLRAIGTCSPSRSRDR